MDSVCVGDQMKDDRDSYDTLDYHVVYEYTGTDGIICSPNMEKKTWQ
jgi:hypothetical protein